MSSDDAESSQMPACRWLTDIPLVSSAVGVRIRIGISRVATLDDSW
jgi:hypothetical protein